MPAADGEPAIEALALTWASITALGADLTEDEWKRPTALPGWTVQDCASHIVGVERMLMGEPEPDVDVGHLAHAQGAINASLERWIEARRAQPGTQVLAELREQTARRLVQLRALSDADLEVVGWSPIGDVPYRTFIAVRVFDCWMHEQDMRTALGRPGHLDGPAVDLALMRFREALGFVVGKKAAAPQGSSVVFELVGAPIPSMAVAVRDRAVVVDQAPRDPTVRLRMPFATFVALGGGRTGGAEALDTGLVAIEGDQELGERVLANMAFTP